MSIFDTVAGWFTSAANGIADLANKAWGSIRSVWNFLVHIAGILSGAWDWMVNGVTWFTSQVSGWAAQVFAFSWHVLTNAIPGAAVG